MNDVIENPSNGPAPGEQPGDSLRTIGHISYALHAIVAIGASVAFAAALVGASAGAAAVGDAGCPLHAVATTVTANAVNTVA